LVPSRSLTALELCRASYFMRELTAPPLQSIPSATGALARLACEKLRSAGLPLTPLLTKAGLTNEQIDNRAVRIAVAAQIKLLEIAAERLGDDLLGFHLARDFELREIGLPYYVLSSSKSLADALSNAERYTKIVNEGVRIKSRVERTTVVTLDYIEVGWRVDRQQVEFWLICLVRICRQLTASRLAPRLVKMRHLRDVTPSEFRTFLGCDVQFGADADEIDFPERFSGLPVVGADEYLHELLVGYAEHALEHRTKSHVSLRSKVEKAIAPLLPHGRARVDTIARELGMSRRTLARALADEGLTFSTILDQYRVGLAKSYLAHSDMPISQIAWLLGYGEVSTFTHAIKRLTGMNPRDLRDSGIAGQMR
jgi:AraC-like DNA-binding protein